MKLFELLVWLAAALQLGRCFVAGPRGSTTVALALLAASVGLILLQVFFEGWRKPIVFAAVALLGLCLMPLALSLLKLPGDGILARLGLAAAGLLLIASTASNWLRPAVSYPTPGGEYAVIGQIAFPVLGQSPVGDVPTPDELRHPPPLLKLWYPAVAPGGSRLLDPAFLAERIAAFGERGKQLPEPAIRNAPPVDLSSPAPLLFYFPGWPGVAIESAALVRELVSHGYYVATIEYPGRQAGMSDERWQALKAELERDFYYGSEARYLELVEVSKDRVRSRARDASIALTRLAEVAATPGQVFSGRFDASRAGFVGFSLGGAVAVQAANQDPRFITAINLDGRMWAEGRADGANKPMLMINEELAPIDPALFTADDPDTRYNAIEDQTDGDALLRNLARHGGQHVMIAGTQHFNFADLCLTSPLDRIAGRGPIAPLRGYEILHAYVLAWFDRALRGKTSPLLDSDRSPYPEVTSRYWPTPVRNGVMAPATASIDATP